MPDFRDFTDSDVAAFLSSRAEEMGIPDELLAGDLIGCQVIRESEGWPVAVIDTSDLPAFLWLHKRRPDHRRKGLGREFVTRLQQRFRPADLVSQPSFYVP